MGSIIIGLFLAIVSCKTFGKKSPRFSAFLVTFFAILGLVIGLAFPFTYGNSEILKSSVLVPIEDDDVYIQFIEDRYHYKFLSESGNAIETSIDASKADIRVSTLSPQHLNYCVEYPSSSFMSFAILKTPRHYYEFTE